MTAPLSPQKAASAMLEAMRAAGMHPREPGAVMADLLGGELIRFHCEGDGKGKRNGWAHLFDEGWRKGVFGSWRLGIKRTWSANGRIAPPSPAERAAREARKAREREALELRQRDAENEARRLWQAAGAPRADHPYLVAKRLEAVARDAGTPQIVVRQSGNVLLLALRDAEGRVCNLQRIWSDGRKRFLKDARIDGCFWHAGDLKGAPVIAVGEGFATMSAVALATGLPVVAAMSAANLAAVSAVLHACLPYNRLIVCADMDDGPRGNLGLAKANDAARAVPGALVAKPPRPAAWPPSKGWDFADTFKAPGGEDLIRRALGMKDIPHG